MALHNMFVDMSRRDSAAAMNEPWQSRVEKGVDFTIDTLESGDSQSVGGMAGVVDEGNLLLSRRQLERIGTRVFSLAGAAAGPSIHETI